MAEPQAHIQAEINPETLDNPALEFLRAYWVAKRGACAMPARKDMVPSELKKYLDGITMIDVLPGMEEFRYRLVGTAVTQYFLTDPTGKTTAEAWTSVGQTAATFICNNLRAIACGRVPVHMWGAVDWTGSGEEEFDSLYLPLSDDGETVNMIMHLFTFDRRRVLLDREIARENNQRPVSC